VLILPSIKIVDPVKGMVPIPLVAANILKVQQDLKKAHNDIIAFFGRTRPALVLSFWHITFAFWMQNLAKPPPEMKVTHVAAQFALVSTLTLSDLRLPLEVITMATADTMAGIFRSTGQCVPISPTPSDAALAPILEIPPALKPKLPKLILCYFLVQKDAHQLEKLLAKEMTDINTYSFGEAEFHCFTSIPLPAPSGRPLSLHSHAKQRQLFQELFARCTGVIVSSGNETVWESVCRGVPVLTMPTTGHGEQLLNARVHARNFPQLVRAAPPHGCVEPGGLLTLPDVRWLVNYEHTDASMAESKHLRDHVSALAGSMSQQGPSHVLAPPA